MSARTVFSLVPDLFFSTRIATTATALGVTLVAPPRAQALERARRQPPDLVILDLHGPDDPLALVRELKSDPATGAVPIVGFYSHVENDLRRAALAAGVDHVLPRSAFTARLAELLAGAPPP